MPLMTNWAAIWHWQRNTSTWTLMRNASNTLWRGIISTWTGFALGQCTLSIWGSHPLVVSRASQANHQVTLHPCFPRFCREEKVSSEVPRQLPSDNGTGQHRCSWTRCNCQSHIAGHDGNGRRMYKSSLGLFERWIWPDITCSRWQNSSLGGRKRANVGVQDASWLWHRGGKNHWRLQAPCQMYILKIMYSIPQTFHISWFEIIWTCRCHPYCGTCWSPPYSVDSLLRKLSQPDAPEQFEDDRMSLNLVTRILKLLSARENSHEIVDILRHFLAFLHKPMASLPNRLLTLRWIAFENSWTDIPTMWTECALQFIGQRI